MYNYLAIIYTLIFLSGKKYHEYYFAITKIKKLIILKLINGVLISMKILITGFMPFGGETTNPAYEAVQLLPDVIDDMQIIKKEIPVVFDKCIIELEKAIIEINPDVVLCVGQAGGRAGISVEKVAINLREARIADNDGNQPIDECIKSDGQTAYFAKLPVKNMIHAMQTAGVPSHISYTAGTYVCNDIMYGLLYLIDTKYKNLLGGFIHVPFSAKQASTKGANVPSMPIETIKKGLYEAIKSINYSENINIAMGETH